MGLAIGLRQQNYAPYAVIVQDETETGCPDVILVEVKIKSAPLVPQVPWLTQVVPADEVQSR
jgi:hypothetical protein